MGGTALNVTTTRLSREEYLRVQDEVVGILNSAGLSCRVTAIPAYNTKESFGDLDVLTSDKVSIEDITKVFNPTEIVVNGPCTSFDFQGFQVDLIYTPLEHFDFSLAYYSWNDLGNLVGRIFKKLGFKYGHKGLYYLLRVGKDHRVFREILVSRDLEKVLTFADLDYNKFQEGFNTLEDMFKWVSASKFFHKDIYLLHNRNHTSRARYTKRKTGSDFLEWCRTTENLNEYSWPSYKETDELVYVSTKSVFLEGAFWAFTGFPEEYLKAEFEYQSIEAAKQVLNGRVVSKLTGLKVKELGVFMRRLGNKYPAGEVRHWTTTKVEQVVLEEMEGIHAT